MRVRLTQDQSAAMLKALIAQFENIGAVKLAAVLKEALTNPRDTFNVADILREELLKAEDARREAQGPVRKRKE
jgi:hypothetical protein